MHTNYKLLILEICHVNSIQNIYSQEITVEA